MSKELKEIGLFKFETANLFRQIELYFSEYSGEAMIIYACDARAFWLFAKKNIYTYRPYLAASKILPDGRPIYWLVKFQLPNYFEQITGPNFMKRVLKDDLFKNKRHMFYGGSQSTIDKLITKCKNERVNVVYAESPPFMDIDNLEVDRVNVLLNKYNVEFFWCGLGAPKQEYLLYQLDKNTNTVMTGVGLGFDYYAGNVKEAPKLVSKIGMEWVFRYGQQPSRIVRFIAPFFYVLRLLFIELIKSKSPFQEH